MLLNLLIAMLSNTYQHIEDSSILEWAHTRTRMTRKLLFMPDVPAPFNLPVAIASLLYSCCPTTKGTAKVTDEELEDADLRHTSSDLRHTSSDLAHTESDLTRMSAEQTDGISDTIGPRLGAALLAQSGGDGDSGAEGDDALDPLLRTASNHSEQVDAWHGGSLKTIERMLGDVAAGVHGSQQRLEALEQQIQALHKEGVKPPAGGRMPIKEAFSSS